MRNPILLYDMKDGLVILMAALLATVALYVATGLGCWMAAHLGWWR